jgi:hypothetical protein
MAGSTSFGAHSGPACSCQTGHSALDTSDSERHPAHEESVVRSRSRLAALRRRQLLNPTAEPDGRVLSARCAFFDGLGLFMGIRIRREAATRPDAMSGSTS